MRKLLMTGGAVLALSAGGAMAADLTGSAADKGALASTGIGLNSNTGGSNGSPVIGSYNTAKPVTTTTSTATSTDSHNAANPITITATKTTNTAKNTATTQGSYNNTAKGSYNTTSTSLANNQSSSSNDSHNVAISSDSHDSTTKVLSKLQDSVLGSGSLSRSTTYTHTTNMLAMTRTEGSVSGNHIAAPRESGLTNGGVSMNGSMSGMGILQASLNSGHAALNQQSVALGSSVGGNGGGLAGFSPSFGR